MSRDDDTPIETPIPQRVASRYRCTAHEALASQVDRIDERTERILELVARIETRVYDTHGAQTETQGTVSTALKIAAIVIAAGAALGGIVSAAIALAQ